VSPSNRRVASKLFSLLLLPINFYQLSAFAGVLGYFHHPTNSSALRPRGLITQHQTSAGRIGQSFGRQNTPNLQLCYLIPIAESHNNLKVRSVQWFIHSLADRHFCRLQTSSTILIPTPLYPYTIQDVTTRRKCKPWCGSGAKI
jgi:hypothetical protein